MEYASAMKELSELSGEVSQNPYMLYDDNWKFNLAFTLANLELYGDKLGGVQSVPSSLQSLNQWLVKIKQETHLLVDNYTKGVDNISEYYINLAVQNIININGYTTKAQAELDKIKSP